MSKRSMQGIRQAGCSTLLLLGGLAHAQNLPDDGPTAAKLEALKREVAEQAAVLDAMKRSMAQQEATIRELRSIVGADALANKRGGQRGGVTGADIATGAATAPAAASGNTGLPNTRNVPVNQAQAPAQAPANGSTTVA